jgi:hypothetical protein
MAMLKGSIRDYSLISVLYFELMEVAIYEHRE